MVNFFLFGMAWAGPWLPTQDLVYHDCKGECLAKKAVAISTPMDFTTYKPQDPLAVYYCERNLKGSMAIKNLGKQRGVCQFRDLSSIELKGIQTGLNTKKRP